MIMNNELKSGTLLQNGKYKIEKVLGSGTFGITYLATTKVKVGGQLGNMEATIKVAIKEFFMEAINGRTGTSVTSGNTDGTYDKYKKKFIKEARNMSRMNHPNIVKVSDIFEANNTCYYVMEYCEGGSLDELIKRKGCLSECESLNYIRQIATALKYMHDNKMLHLDLKPGNVVLRENGDAVLIDFGLSKQFDKNGKAETSTNVGLGTPGYAPIEQSNYDGSTFPVTMDVYALGGTWFKMLTGTCPPDASTILNQGFPAYELQNKNVSDQTIQSIAKAMRPLYKDRTQSVGEFLNMLGGDTTSRDNTIFEKEHERGNIEDPKPKQNNKPKNNWWITTVILLVVVLLGIFMASYDEAIKDRRMYSSTIIEASNLANDNNLLQAKQKYQEALKYENEYAGSIFSGMFGEYVQNKINSIDYKINEIEAERLAAEKAEQERLEKQRKEREARKKREREAELERQRKESEIAEKERIAKLEEEKKKLEHGVINGHEYVDLGLPSRLKWATCNVGANSPEDYGNYYAWGETNTKSSYTISNSKTYGKKIDYIKDESQYDAARANWGSSWRLPSEREFEELVKECIWQWITYNGEKGYKVIGPNGNNIFLPTGGCREGTVINNTDKRGFYWSSTADDYNDNKNAHSLYVNEKFQVVNFANRNIGYNIRPVTR